MDKSVTTTAVAVMVILIVAGGIWYLETSDDDDNGLSKIDPISVIKPNRAYVTIVYESDHILKCNCTLSATNQRDATVDIPGYGTVIKSYSYEWSGTKTMDVTAKMHARGALGDKFDYETITIYNGQSYTIHLKA